MDFDLRFREYTFKHTYSKQPDLSAERYREHYHTAYELLYFISGDAQFMIQHNLYNIRPGSLLLVKPGEYHNIVFRSKAPYERYVIRFSPQVVRPRFIKLLDMTKSVYYIADSPIDEEFRRLDSHMSALHKDCRLDACIGSLIILLSYIISSDKLAQKADYINNDSRQIIEYIDRNLADIQSVNDICAALHMSKSTVYSIFSEQMNTSLMAYVRTQKCIVAKNLMYEGFSATEAADQLGFQHYSSFYRDYMKVFHEPPSGKPKRSAEDTDPQNM